MGFLTEGNTLGWEETRKVADYIRKHGIIQFLHIYETTKLRTRDCLIFGDEIEYLLLSLYEDNKKAFLSLRGPEILEQLEEESEQTGLVAPPHPLTNAATHALSSSTLIDFSSP